MGGERPCHCVRLAAALDAVSASLQRKEKVTLAQVPHLHSKCASWLHHNQGQALVSKGGTWRSESMDTGTSLKSWLPPPQHAWPCTSLLCWLPPPQHVWPCKWISPTLSHTGKEGRTTRECGWRSARIAAPRRQWNTLWPVHSHIEAAQHQKSMSSILLGAQPVCVCVH